MGKIDIIGVTQKLKLEPKNILPENHSQPTQRQMVGATVPLQTSVSTVKYGAGVPDGQRQMVGITVPLKDKPYSGWQSYDTPPSERTVVQKKSY